MPTPLRHLILFAIAVVVLASCSTSEPEQAAPSPSSTTTPAPPGLDRFYGQKLDWGSCADFQTGAEPLDRNLECTRVEVPIDYTKPDGTTGTIAMSRYKATRQRIGSILVNPGGPGMTGLAQASMGASTPLGDRFDVIGFDPRGVGASTPQIHCFTAAEEDADRKEPDVDNSPEGIAKTEQKHKDEAAKCAERSTPELLAHVGTREVVKDMDVIRAVLGDDKLTYLGYSYGTRIGAAYAEAFPDRVRALVLDGAVDPDEQPIDSIVEQVTGFQKVFDSFAADCAKSEKCPLGTDPAQASKQFRALVNPLVDKPAQTTDPRGLSYEDAQTGVQQALYTPELWRVLTVGLDEVRNGRGDTLLQLADAYEGRKEDGTYTNLNDAFDAIRCVDDPPVTDRAAAGAADTKIRELAPFLDDGRGTGQVALDLCAFWPVPNTSAPHVISIPNLPRVVVVSTTGDPATPYAAGVDLAKQLGAALFTYKGDQHTVSFTSGVQCIDEAVLNYLVDPAAQVSDETC